MVSTRLMSTINQPEAADSHSTAANVATTTVSAQPQSQSQSQSQSQLQPGVTGTVTSNLLPSNVNPRLELLNLPLEILDKICSYLGYKNVAQMRIVSHQMNFVCSAILNSTFQKLQTQMQNRFQSVRAKMPRRESARRTHPLACECDIIETCYMRLSLLQMTFGKHIERKHCCFFPGGILDEVYNVLNYIRLSPMPGRRYKVTDELFDLSTMAMEYFKEHIEPNLPEIAYFSKDFLDYATNAKPSFMLENTSSSSDTSRASSQPSPPQSNMVLRKGIRKIKQGMKRYNNQLSLLRGALRSCKRKATEQAKQIAEQQKLLAEQQKQTLEYANRLDENDKKNEEMSRKFSTLLQELNKCKTDLQYWRSKSPATPACSQCGHMRAISFEDIHRMPENSPTMSVSTTVAMPSAIIGDMHHTIDSVGTTILSLPIDGSPKTSGKRRANTNAAAAAAAAAESTACDTIPPMGTAKVRRVKSGAGAKQSAAAAAAACSSSSTISAGAAHSIVPPSAGSASALSSVNCVSGGAPALVSGNSTANSGGGGGGGGGSSGGGGSASSRSGKVTRNQAK